MRRGMVGDKKGSQVRLTNRVIRLFLITAFVSGCATLDAKVAIPVSCIKDAPAVPQPATEAEILAMSEYAGTLTTWTERLELKAYAAKADAIIQACR